MKRFKSFLIINIYGIGDVLFSTPIIAGLKEQYPGCLIYYLCSYKAYPIVKTHKDIEKVFVYERDEFEMFRKKSFFVWIMKWIRFVKEIRACKIDAAIDLSINPLFSPLMFAAGINVRAGLDYKQRGFLLTKKKIITGFNDKHVAEYYLDAARLLNSNIQSYPMNVCVDSEARIWADSFCKNNNIIDTDVIIGIAPCGGQAFGKDMYAKRWPIENYAELINRLIERYKAKIFIIAAGYTEQQEVAALMKSIKNTQFCFTFDVGLAATVALIDKCGLFIGNDTGPVRIADALNKKIIILFGLADERVYGPYPLTSNKKVIKKDMPCRPCYRKFRLAKCDKNLACLKSITIEEVFAAAGDFLK